MPYFLLISVLGIKPRNRHIPGTYFFHSAVSLSPVNLAIYFCSNILHFPGIEGLSLRNHIAKPGGFDQHQSKLQIIFTDYYISCHEVQSYLLVKRMNRNKWIAFRVTAE